MDVKDLIVFMAFVSIVFIPALAITARFALKPIVESILRLREEFSNAPRPQLIPPDQLRALQQEIADLRDSVEKLHDVVEFERALKRPSDTKQITSSAT